MLIGDIYQQPRVADYVDPDGSVMLLCDGRVVNPAIYPALFAMTGANLPNFTNVAPSEGFSPVGASAAGGYPLLSTGGSRQHAHTCAAVNVAHIWAGPTTIPLEGPWWFPAVPVNCLAGPNGAADPLHTHDMPAIPYPNHNAVPDPVNMTNVSPLLAVGFFIKAA